VRETPDLPAIDILTLTYNSERFIDGFFRAFAEVDFPPAKLRLNILDNGSDDRSVDIIERGYAKSADYPFEVRVFRSPTNDGFSGGNNTLMRRAISEGWAHYFMLINIDTEIHPGCVKELLSLHRDDPSVGISEAVQEPKEHPKWYDPKTFETGWCSAGCALIFRDVLEEVGLFDERFFLYCEDVDLSWRMWLHGWKCKINPRARYVHYTEDLDPNKTDSGLYYRLRNGFYMHYKYDTLRGIRAHGRRFLQAMKSESDPKRIEVFRRAWKDARKKKWSFLLSRNRLRSLPRTPWIVFNGFDYERRRRFEDTPDGKRTIYAD